MIDIKHLAQNVERYRQELEKRGGNPDFATQAYDIYENWKSQNTELDELLSQKNEFNKNIGMLSAEERESGLAQMKKLSIDIKGRETKVKELSEALKKAISKVPNLSYDEIPLGKSDEDNPVVQVW